VTREIWATLSKAVRTKLGPLSAQFIVVRVAVVSPRRKSLSLVVFLLSAVPLLPPVLDPRSATGAPPPATTTTEGEKQPAEK
jgi:hypothetical protein